MANSGPASDIFQMQVRKGASVPVFTITGPTPEATPPNPVNVEQNQIMPAHNLEQADLEKEQQIQTTPRHSAEPKETHNGEGAPDKPSGITRSSCKIRQTSAQLSGKLQKARIEYPPKSYHFFVPKLDRDKIITERVILDEILAGGPSMSTERAQAYAKKVYDRAKNLFAVLAYMEKGAEICAFMDENISDEDFPFERSEHQDRKCEFSLQLKNGKKVEVMEAWASGERETFGQKQWFMFAPEFKDKKHYKLHSNTVLPFIDGSDQQPDKVSSTGGGYSKVFFARIHYSHYDCSGYWAPKDEHPDVAIKKLLTKEPKDFENERSILIQLGSKSNPHPHLVKLLASYEINEEFFLIFPRARCNLRGYWESRPNPDFDWDTMFWSLKQMKGIAQGLNTVHKFKVTNPLDHKGKNRTPQRDVELRVTPREARYGRHGDIKPENIIFFEPGPGCTDDPRGILQIADFGLGRFHGRESKTEQWPHNIFGSPTYEPPECKLHKAVSRVYDLWSLGCLYLEFATWLLKGAAHIKGFSDCRARNWSSNPSISDDLFFTIIRDENGNPLDAEVREGVKVWVLELHQHPKCSAFIHELLDLIMEDLLRIDANDRIETSALCSRFEDFYAKAERDREYLRVGRPRVPAHGAGDTSTHASSERTIVSHDHLQKPSGASKSPKKVVAFDTTELGETPSSQAMYQPSSPKSFS